MAAGVALRRARAALAAGAIGDVRYCRVSSPGWRAVLPLVLGDRARPVVEVHPAAGGLTLLGTKATLVLQAAACRVYPASEV